MNSEFNSYQVFGIVDNIVMLAGAYGGFNIEKKLPKKLQSGMGAIYGAGLGNAFSDFLGGISTLNYSLAFGTALGCLYCLACVPIVNWYFKHKLNGA